MDAREENIGALRDSVRAGATVSLLLCAALAAYFLLTPDGPKRTEFLLGAAAVAVVSLLILRMPVEPLVRRGLVSTFFTAWSGTVVVLTTLAVIVEDDPTTPLVAV